MDVIINNILDLNEDEFNQINEQIRLKIIKNCDNFYQKHENLKNNYEKFKIEYGELKIKNSLCFFTCF